MRLNKLVNQSLNNNQASIEDVESQNVLDETVEIADSSEDSKTESESDQGESSKMDVGVDEKEEPAEIEKEEVSSEEPVTVAESSDIQVSFSKYEKQGDDYLFLFFLVTNNSDSIANIHTNQYHYINGISVGQAFSDMQNEIAPKKSAQLKVAFKTKDLSVLDGSIDTFDLQLYLENEQEKVPFEMSFKGLNIAF